MEDLNVQGEVPSPSPGLTRDMVALFLHLLLLHSVWSPHCLGCHLVMGPIPPAPWNPRLAPECIYLTVGLGTGWRGLLRIPRLWLTTE